MNEQQTSEAGLGHIQKLAAEEHHLLEQKSRDGAQEKRLAQIQVELDQCWDLLRQRRALREMGMDPAKAEVRSAEVVKKYIG